MDNTNASPAVNVAEIRDLVEAYIKPSVQLLDDPTSGVQGLFTVSNGGATPIPPALFDPFRTKPVRRTGTAKMFTIDSLIDHTNRFKSLDTVVFADQNRDAPSITTVLDYHPESESVQDAMFGQHRARHDFPLSDEWKAWSAANGQPMGMADFAAFIENRLPDVLYLIPGEDELPEDIQRLIDTLGGSDAIATPNKLMELARGLQINEESVVQEAVNLQSGEGIIRFQSRHVDETGAPVRVPSVFLLAIPVFQGGEFYRVAARLRYRKSGGLKFWYELYRTDRTFDHAFRMAVERVAAETGLPVLYGKPEM